VVDLVVDLVGDPLIDPAVCNVTKAETRLRVIFPRTIAVNLVRISWWIQ